MLKDFFSVDEHLCAVVHAGKMKEDVLTVPCLWDAECAMIPDGGDKVLMSDARQFALRAERHGDVPSESFRLIQFVLHATLAEVQLTGPCTVQALPVGTLKLWTRILTARLRRLSLRSSEKQCHEGDKD